MVGTSTVAGPFRIPPTLQMLTQPETQALRSHLTEGLGLGILSTFPVSNGSETVLKMAAVSFNDFKNYFHCGKIHTT